MKIAIASENGKTVSRHFGRATQYVIISTENTKTLNREVRPKVGHLHSDCAKYNKSGCECRNQSCEASVYDRHRTMVVNILDCSVLIAGGMGWGVYEVLKSRGIKPVITKSEAIEEAVKLYLSDNLPNLMECLH